MKKRVNTFHTCSTKFDYDRRIISKSTDAKIYRGVTLLTPGVFVDSITQAPVKYSKEVLKKYATNWVENYLNLDHSYETLNRIGFIENPRFEDGVVKADLYIYPVTDNAKDVINLIDSGLINWLSVEMKTEDKWDKSTGQRYVEKIEFIGAAVCTLPADPNTRINQDGPGPGKVWYE